MLYQPSRLHSVSLLGQGALHLDVVKEVGAGSPVAKEQAEADGLEDAGESANGNGVEGALFGEDLGDELVASQRFRIARKEYAIFDAYGG